MQAAGREHGFAEEVLDFRSKPHEFGSRRKLVPVFLVAARFGTASATRR